MCWLLRSSSISPNFDTGGSKFGRNFDQTSTPQCRSSVEVWSKFGVAVWCRSLVDILSNLQCISLMHRANFNQTSTPGVSKFGRSLVEVWSKFRHPHRSKSTILSKQIHYFIPNHRLFVQQPFK